MKQKSNIYLLWSVKENEILTVTTSIAQLKNLVDCFIKASPDKTLSYEKWVAGERSPRCWDWCYIASHSKKTDLASGGGLVPKQYEWGRNIVSGYDYEGKESSGSETI